MSEGERKQMIDGMVELISKCNMGDAGGEIVVVFVVLIDDETSGMIM